MTPHLFALVIDLDYAGSPIGQAIVKFQANLYVDGSLKSVDIMEVDYKGNDIAGYVCAAQPETWEEWTLACEDHYNKIVYEPAPVEHD